MSHRNGENLSDFDIDELERVTAEMRCLLRRTRKAGFDEIAYMLGLAEESAKQTLKDNTRCLNQKMMETEDDSTRVIRFPARG